MNRNCKRLFVILLSTLTLNTSADEFSTREPHPVPKVAWSPKQVQVQITSNNEYMFIRRAVHLAKDHGQIEALNKTADLVVAQLHDMTRSYNPAFDPTGDLANLATGLEAFRQHVTKLTAFATSVYGAIDNEKAKWDSWFGEAVDPTGLIIYGTLEGTKNVLNWLPIPYLRSVVQGGAAMTGGVVLVPMEVTKIAIKDQRVERYIEWDSSVILMMTANAGVGVSTIADDTNRRIGAGLIWGHLNSASDLFGLSGGVSETIEYQKIPGLPDFLQSGLNLELMGVVNPFTPGAVANVIGLIGLEGGDTPSWNAQVPWLHWNLQSHFIISMIFDLKSIWSGINTHVEGMFSRLTDY